MGCALQYKYNITIGQYVVDVSYSSVHLSTSSPVFYVCCIHRLSSGHFISVCFLLPDEGVHRAGSGEPGDGVGGSEALGGVLPTHGCG